MRRKILARMPNQTIRSRLFREQNNFNHARKTKFSMHKGEKMRFVIVVLPWKPSEIEYGNANVSFLLSFHREMSRRELYRRIHE